jgi:phosphoserine phosphatase
MALAIFDIDGTLVTGASTERRFYLELLRSGNQGPRQVTAALAFLLVMSPRYGRQVFKKNKAYLAWLNRRKLQDLASHWTAMALERHWFKPALQRLRQHQAAGDSVLLLSGTPQFIAAGIAARLGVDEYLGSVCAERTASFDWRPPLRHPFGVEKLAIAADYARARSIAPTEVSAYADSHHDLPLLVWSGRAVAVRPDRQLARVAAQRHWEILGDRSSDRDGSGSLSEQQ